MTNEIRVASAAVLALLAAACGGTANPGTTPELSVSPSTRTVTAGSPASTFTAALTNGSATISWSLAPAQGTLSAATGPSTDYTPPLSIGSTTSVTLTATAGALTATATIIVNPAGSGTVTVNGKVLLGRTPLAGAPVRIDPGAHTTTAAADGTFTLSGVTTPYALSAIHAAGKVAVVYAGLTRADPTAVIPSGGTVTFTNHGKVSGTVEASTGCRSGTAACENNLGFGSPVASGVASDGVLTPGQYSINLGWDGATSVPGTLHLLQASTNPIGATTSYWYGSKTGVTVTNGGDTVESWDPSSVAPLPAATLSGTGTVASGYTIQDATLLLALPNVTLHATTCSSSLPPVEPPCAPGAFRAWVPDVAGATLTSAVVALGPHGESVVTVRTGGVANGSGFDFAIQAGPSLQAPANGATGVSTATPFSWTAFSGGIHVVAFEPTTATDPVFYVYTSGTSATVPDLGGLSAAGALPAGAAYTWGVTAYAPATVDAWASPSGPPLGNPSTSGFSQAFGFTTR